MNNIPESLRYEPESNPNFKPPKTVFSKEQKIFAFISLLLGYLFIKFVFQGMLGISVTIFSFIFCFSVFFYFKKIGKKITSYPILIMSIILLFSLNFGISSDGFVKALDLILIFVLAVYFVALLGDEKSEMKLDEKIIPDFLRSLFSSFSSFSKCPSALNDLISKKGFSKTIVFVLLGLLAIFPAFSIILILLMRADTAFSDMFSEIINTICKFINFSEIFTLLISIPISFYIFGTVYSSTDGRKSNIYLKNEKKQTGLPLAFICSALSPILILYMLFFVSQASYFLSAFFNIKPEGISYADYARKGFFELCVVSVINLIIFIFSNATSKNKDGKVYRTVKILSSVLCAFTLLLITTALSKMIMYINCYGLTLMRIYTSIFMILLTILFVFLIVRSVKENFNLVKYFSYCFIVIALIFSFVDFSAISASYNIQKYMSGSLKEIDIYAMNDLSDSAVKYVIPLASDNSKYSQAAKSYLNIKKQKFYRFDKINDFRSFNISTYFAQKALNKINIY